MSTKQEGETITVSIRLHKKLYDRLFKICLAVFVAGLTFGGGLVVAWVVRCWNIV